MFKGELTYFDSEYSKCLSLPKTLQRFQKTVKDTEYFHSLDLIRNSPYCLPYNLHDTGLENLALDQLIIPLLIFFSILTPCLLDIVLIL